MIREHHIPIIEPREIGELARPCEVEEATARRAIEEAEMLDVRPKVGGELFLRITDGIRYGLLLEGGEYAAPCGGRRVFGGLKRAVAYYAWGRLVRDGDSRLTRFGYVTKNDDYSHQPEFKERLQAYENAFAVADGYMQECLLYMRENPDLFPDLKGKFTSERIRTRVIGK